MLVEHSSSIDTNWFQDKIKERDLSQRRIAKRMGIDQSALSLLLRGKRKVSTTEAGELASILGLPISEVLDRLGVKAPRGATSIPIVGVVDDDGTVRPTKQSARIFAPAELPEKAVAVRNEDPKSLLYGWVSLFEPKTDIPREAIGRMCVVTLKDGSRVMRFLRQGLDPGTWALIPPLGGDAATTTSEVVAAAPILWVRP